jgi:hypothetical protein
LAVTVLLLSTVALYITADLIHHIVTDRTLRE